MDRDEDIARLLPEPPPPRPARRDAAIAAAMRRFDGTAEPARDAAHRPAPTRPAMRWGPIGAFASVLLVLFISVPIALHSPGGPLTTPGPQSGAPTVERTPAPRAVQSAGSGLPSAARQASCAAAGCERDANRLEDSRTPSAAPEMADKAVAGGDAGQGRAITAQVERAAPLPAPETKMAAAAPEPAASGDTDIVVTGSRAAPRAMMESPTSVTVISAAELSDRDVVVTAARSRARTTSRRGDWNACTANDPEQSLRGCEHLVDLRAKGPRGVAAAILSDGLVRAWRGDWDGAIDAFDRAIALQPRLAFAYLNRGLAYQRKGDLTRATADLDLAIRNAPRAARGYYNRGILRRARGDMRGAKADAERAAALDSRYGPVVE